MKSIMANASQSRFSARSLDMMRFGFFGLAVMVMTFFMTSVFTTEIPALADETYFVNTADDTDDGTCDDAHCSLREAITAANLKVNGEGIDRIYFEIPEDKSHTIVLERPLPTITDPVIIDATTQLEYQEKPLVEVSGGNKVLDGFVITSGESIVRGIVIRDFKGAGVYIIGYGANRIEGSYICTDASGSGVSANKIGIHIDDSPGNIVGGKTRMSQNVISGCAHASIVISGPESKENLVFGNDIGVDVNGEQLGASMGILFDDAVDNIVGGPSDAEKNTIYNGEGQGFVTAGQSENANNILENILVE